MNKTDANYLSKLTFMIADKIMKDLDYVQRLHRALGEPYPMPAVLADLADMTSVSVKRITGFFRYGYLALGKP